MISLFGLNLPVVEELEVEADYLGGSPMRGGSGRFTARHRGVRRTYQGSTGPMPLAEARGLAAILSSDFDTFSWEETLSSDLGVEASGSATAGSGTLTVTGTCTFSPGAGQYGSTLAIVNGGIGYVVTIGSSVAAYADGALVPLPSWLTVTSDSFTLAAGTYSKALWIRFPLPASQATALSMWLPNGLFLKAPVATVEGTIHGGYAPTLGSLSLTTGANGSIDGALEFTLTHAKP